MTMKKTVMSMLGGATLAYLFDPSNGKARRVRLTDQAAARMRNLREAAAAKTTYQRNVVEGWVHEAKGAMRPPRTFDDATLVQKIKSETLGNWTAQGHPPVEVDVSAGRVTLATELTDPGSREELLRRVERVEGVSEANYREPRSVPE